ncbi:MAG TPA: hypothetical protein VMF50_15755 [Candidatus Binataceae bacterium]|nr:hypothetical protein [Candidatus Binataceae bacterium]
MADPLRVLVVSLVACVFFGYAAINCLVFYRRNRQRAAHYSGSPQVEALVRSPLYSWTFWITGVVGLVGFLIASWRLVLAVSVMLH